MVGLLTDEFDDVRLMTSRAVLRTSMTLLTSRRHDMTLRDVVDDDSVTPGTIVHSRAERLLRRSRLPIHRRLWRRISDRRKSRQHGTLSRRVVTPNAGVSRVLNATNEQFVLIMESTDAAYVTSRRPGCTLTVADQNVSIAEYRFVAAATSSTSSWRRHLLQRLCASLATLHRAAVIKRLYYKWWTSTDCLTHFIDPNIWNLSVNRSAVDVDETADDDRIFLQAPMSVTRATSTKRDRSASTRRISDDELSRVSRVTTTSGFNHSTVADTSHHRHTRSLVVSAATTLTSSSPLTTTATPTTTKLPLRSQRIPGDNTRNDNFYHITSSKNTSKYDDFDYVYITYGAATGYDDEVNSDGLQVSEQEMAVQEHWRAGGNSALSDDVRQSTSTMTTASDCSQSTYVIDGGSGASDGCSQVKSSSVTLLIVIVLLLFHFDMHTALHWRL